MPLSLCSSHMCLKPVHWLTSPTPVQHKLRHVLIVWGICWTGKKCFWELFRDIRTFTVSSNFRYSSEVYKGLRYLVPLHDRHFVVSVWYWARVGWVKRGGIIWEYTSNLVKRVICFYISQHISQVPNLVIKNYFHMSYSVYNFW